MFDHEADFRDLAKVDAEHRQLLCRLRAIQADCEIGGPHLYLPTTFRLALAN